tara:strand:- start:1122 stop:1835 length:714 start_codon:yes stop_codon:yes gene_type:complete
MSVVAAAVIGSAVVGAYSANKAGKAMEKGAKTGAAAEERMADKNLAFQREMADEQRADFQPWRDAGQRALASIEQGIESGAFEVGKINLEDDPGYRVRMQEGIDALDASASARGRLLSGAQDKAITRFGQEQGSKEYANAYARELQQKQQKYNILSNISQGGQSSAAGQAQASGQLASSGGNIMANTGRSQNIMNQNAGNARASGYQDQAQVVNQAAQNWLSYKMNTPATTNTNNLQ